MAMMRQQLEVDLTITLDIGELETAIWETFRDCPKPPATGWRNYVSRIATQALRDETQRQVETQLRARVEAAR